MAKLIPFHIAIPVHNLDECRTFYREILNCEEGRSSKQWVDFNFFGHQLVIHYKPKHNDELHTNPVDGKTSLQFSLFKASKPQNPKLWLARL